MYFTPTHGVMSNHCVLKVYSPFILAWTTRTVMQNHYDYRNTCAKKDIQWKPYDCVNMIVVNQIFSNAFFRASKFKLYKQKRTKHLDFQLQVACSVYNHWITLCRRYYKLNKRTLNKFKLQNTCQNLWIYQSILTETKLLLIRFKILKTGCIKDTNFGWRIWKRNQSVLSLMVW